MSGVKNILSLLSSSLRNPEFSNPRRFEDLKEVERRRRRRRRRNVTIFNLN